MLQWLVAAGMLSTPTAVEWKVSEGKTVPPAATGQCGLVHVHERGFSIPAGWFIHVVLLEYGLQLHHLNPNSMQRMAAFEGRCVRGTWAWRSIGICFATSSSLCA